MTLSGDGSTTRPALREWLRVLQRVWPMYLAVHLAFLALTYVAPLFRLKNFSGNALPVITLLNEWNRWDTSLYTAIAQHGYTVRRIAFFPMLPVLERGLAAIVHNPFVAGLIISNLACLGLFMVLYRLVSEDFDESAAGRTVLYMAVFPAAFFLAAAYNESLFLLFSVSSFRYMRRGRWWLAGLAAVGAGLTRSIGVCLVIPFLYEYMHQRGWQARAIRRDIVALLGIFAGPAVMMVYGAVTYHDYLAFAHAQRFWKRHLSPPWTVFSDAYHILAHNGALTFVTIHSAIDLGAVLFALVLLVATFAGPLKLRRDQWSYGFYAATLYLAVILVPEGGTYPLSSLSRFILEIFPLFVVLAHRDRQGSIGIYYVTISGSLLAFMLLQWLSGGWIV